MIQMGPIPDEELPNLEEEEEGNYCQNRLTLAAYGEAEYVPPNEAPHNVVQVDDEDMLDAGIAFQHLPMDDGGEDEDYVFPEAELVVDDDDDDVDMGGSGNR